jgi:hypothetical protein
MTHNRAGPARQNSGYEVALYGQSVVNCVHARVHAAHPPHLLPMPYCLRGHAGCQQLAPADHPVLCRGQLRDRHVDMFRRRSPARWQGFLLL